MSLEEIKSREENCTELARVMQEGLDKLDRSDRRAAELDLLKDQASEFETSLDAIKIELKSPTIAHSDRELYKKRHKELKAILEELNTNIKWKEQDATRSELMDDRPPAATGLDTEAGLIAHGDAVQQASKDSLARTVANVTTAVSIGKEVTVKLKTQSQLISAQLDDLYVIENTVDRSAEILKRMARRVASDKYMWVMVFLVFAAIVFIIVWKNIDSDADVAVPDVLIQK